MKLTYDKETDTLLIVLKSKAIDETEEIRPGVLADLDETSALVSLEILNASPVTRRWNWEWRDVILFSQLK